MKFSQLVIASAAIAAGVEGFSTSKLSVVRQVSKSSIVYWKLFVIAYGIKRENNGEKFGTTYWWDVFISSIGKCTRYVQYLCFAIHNGQ